VHQGGEAALVLVVEVAPGVEAVSHGVEAEVLPQEEEAVQEGVLLVVADDFLHPACIFCRFQGVLGVTYGA